MNNRVAILSTGDEVINGDILNSNAHDIARVLFSNNIAVGQHLSVRDDIESIQTALHYLVGQHQSVIITGGLGPTRDDVTREALSGYCQRPLELDEVSLNALEMHFKKVGLPLADNNRQQAYFPQDATVIINHNGTANGCSLTYQNKQLFMLPGPPSEMMPMIESDVLPALLHLQQRDCLYQKWMVFGIAESTLANLIDDVLLKYSDNIGYRFVYPYIEVKAFYRTAEDSKQAHDEINQLLIPFNRELLTETAGTQLKHSLANLSKPIKITDKATGGELEKLLVSPTNYQYINFYDDNHKDYLAEFTLSGLTAYWKQRDDIETELLVSSQFGEDILMVRNYGKRALLHAAESVAFYLLDKLPLCK